MENRVNEIVTKSINLKVLVDLYSKHIYYDYYIFYDSLHTRMFALFFLTLS